MNDFKSIEKSEWDREPDADALERAASIDDFLGREGAFNKLVDAGSILSMINLAHLYEHRPQQFGGFDVDLCEKWYRRAIEAKSILATFQFGYFYLRRKDYINAMEMFDIGAKKGCAPSMIRLADLYIHGLGVARDINRARVILNRAGGLGNLWAKRALARMDKNAGGNYYIKLKGAVMCYVTDLQFNFEARRNPKSERLKK